MDQKKLSQLRTIIWQGEEWINENIFDNTVLISLHLTGEQRVSWQF